MQLDHVPLKSDMSQKRLEPYHVYLSDCVVSSWWRKQGLEGFWPFINQILVIVDPNMESNQSERMKGSDLIWLKIVAFIWP